MAIVARRRRGPAGRPDRRRGAEPRRTGRWNRSDVKTAATLLAPCARLRVLLVAACAVVLLGATVPAAQGGPAANRDVTRFLKQVRGKRTLVVAFHPF